MKLAHRFAWYLGGFGIGLILLFFFLGGKKTSCDYGLDARTLKNIRIKKRIISEVSLQSLADHSLDTAAISEVLHSGDVNFSESNTSLDSCKQYIVTGEVAQKELRLRIENCDSIATIMEVQINN